MISNADFFVMPSLSEGWPLVIGEVMALGLPVLATYASSYDFLNEEKLGMNVELENLAAGLEIMCKKSEQELYTMGQNCIAWTKSNLDYSNIAEKHLDGYNSTFDE